MYFSTLVYPVWSKSPVASAALSGFRPHLSFQLSGMPSRSESTDAVPPAIVPYPLLPRPVLVWWLHRFPLVPSDRTSDRTRLSTWSLGSAPDFATLPPRPPVATAPNPTAPGKATTGPDGAADVVLTDHCMRAMSEQVSSTIGLVPAVEPSLSLTHRPVPTLLMRYLP